MNLGMNYSRKKSILGEGFSYLSIKQNQVSRIINGGRYHIRDCSDWQRTYSECTLGKSAAITKIATVSIPKVF